MLTSQLGYREGRNNDNFFGEWYGMNHLAWCAMFLTWGSRMSGCKDIVPRFASTPKGAEWFRDQGQWHSTPRVGDFGFKYGPVQGEPQPRIHHVFVVTKVLGSHVLTIEGNTNSDGSRDSNGVYSLKRAAGLGPHAGYGRPAYAAGPAESPPVDLSDVADKARRIGKYDGRVAAALTMEGLPPTVAGYAKWQEQLGYSGADADGIAGLASLTKLGGKHGWEVQP